MRVWRHIKCGIILECMQFVWIICLAQSNEIIYERNASCFIFSIRELDVPIQSMVGWKVRETSSLLLVRVFCAVYVLYHRSALLMALLCVLYLHFRQMCFFYIFSHHIQLHFCILHLYLYILYLATINIIKKYRSPSCVFTYLHAIFFVYNYNTIFDPLELMIPVDMRTHSCILLYRYCISSI